MSDRTLKKIRKLIEEEKTALLAGEYESLESLGLRRINLIEALNLTEIEATDIETLMDEVYHVQTLTETALLGVREAREAFEARIAARSRLETYGPDGQPKSIEAGVRTTIKRA